MFVFLIVSVCVFVCVFVYVIVRVLMCLNSCVCLFDGLCLRLCVNLMYVFVRLVNYLRVRLFDCL